MGFSFFRMLPNRSQLGHLFLFIFLKTTLIDGFQPLKSASSIAAIYRISRSPLLNPPQLRYRKPSCSRLQSLQNVSPSEEKKSLKERWSFAIRDIRTNPWAYITIPIVAALVGYITNYVGVKMLFYPIKWRGIPLYRWENQPLGLIGWQGIVPAKRRAMASTMVDVTISRLLSIPEVFSMLQPHKLAPLLAPTVSSSVLKGLVPSPLLKFFLRRTSRDIIKNIESVVDIKSIVVTGLTTDPSTFGNFFQKVGAKELRFLIESGMGFGFLLGLIQMVLWMFFPLNWTLPVCGAVVGYITNWIALKWIFEPLLPTKVGPFILQGMFIRRQKEVSREFSEYIAKNVLNSQRVWRSIMGGTKSEQFRNILTRNIPLPSAAIGTIINQLQKHVGDVATHPLHGYTDVRLRLQETLTTRMNLLSPAEFQQVLRPIFQEDEFTLIVAGGILGGLAGLLQWYINVELKKRSDIKKLKDKETILLTVETK